MMPSSFSSGKKSPKHVIIVMNALKGFQKEPLEWMLENTPFKDGWSFTLLGVTPWLHVPFRLGTFWTLNLEDFLARNEATEWKDNVEHRQVQEFVDLCHRYGVVPLPKIRCLMGYPLKELVVKEITSLEATLVVVDRHHDRKDVEYYRKKVPCNVIRIHNNGG